MFEVGKTYNRQREIHDVYGGNRQSGIASCRDYPYVFLFTASSGEKFGYKDGWISDSEYWYTGEGQYGEMEFVRGNRAIKDHVINGKQLHMFEQNKNGQYEYLGEFQYRSFENKKGKDAKE